MLKLTVSFVSFVTFVCCMLMGIFSAMGICALLFGPSILDTVLGDQPDHTHPAFAIFLLTMVPGMLIGACGGFFGVVVPLHRKFGLPLSGMSEGMKARLARHTDLRSLPVAAASTAARKRIPSPFARIRKATVTDSAGWLRLREMLWPGAAHQVDIARHFDHPNPGVTLVAEDAAGKIIAFAEISVRTDWVDGATTSPVAFLEGIFVDPAVRGTGIARALVSAAVDWARGSGYQELGSNAEIGNGNAIAFHLACGFREAERNVSFIMSCQVDPSIQPTK